MSAPKAGDSFPEGVTFTYVPPTGKADVLACGVPVKYKASDGECEPPPSVSCRR